LTSVTAFFAAVPKIIIFSVIIQLTFFVFEDFADFSSTLFRCCGVASVCVASVAALYQKRLKRLLAYSTISHTGFILLGICCVSIDAVNSCIIYIALYSVMSIALFSVILMSNDGKISPKYIIN